MSIFQKRRWMIELGLVCLIPVVLLGLFLFSTLKSNIQTRAIADARERAQLVAQVGVSGPLDGVHDLTHGLTAQQQAALDRNLETIRSGSGLARVVIRNRTGRTIYADDHSLIGKSAAPGGAGDALDGSI